MSGRSTVTNLLEFSNIAISVVKSGEQLDVKYTDFRKAFDRIQHRILLKKLKKFGIFFITLLGTIIFSRQVSIY